MILKTPSRDTNQQRHTSSKKDVTDVITYLRREQHHRVWGGLPQSQHHLAHARTDQHVCARTRPCIIVGIEIGVWYSILPAFLYNIGIPKYIFILCDITYVVIVSAIVQ